MFRKTSLNTLKSKKMYVSRIYTMVIFSLFSLILSGQAGLDSIKGMVTNPEFSDSLRADKAQRLAGYYMGRNMDSSRYYIAIALKIAEGSEHEALILDIKLGRVDINRFDWSLDTMDQLYKSILSEAKKKNYKEILLSGLISHSALFMNKGRSEEGIEILLKAIPIAEELEDYSQLGKTQFNIAAAYSNMGMNELAIEKLKDAYQSFRKDGQTEFTLFTLNSIANCFNNLDQQDSAYHYLDIILPQVDSINYTRLQVGARSTYGAMLLSQKKYKEAKDLFDESLPFAEKMGNEMTLGNCHCNLGRANFYLENYSEAMQHFEKAYSYPNFDNNLVATQYCLKEMAMTHRKLGNHQLAGQFMEDYIHYQDTVLLKENKIVVAELEEKFESAKKEAEIKIQEAEINQKTYQRNLLFGGLGLSLLLGSSFIWGLLSRNKRNKKIATQAQDIQSQKIETLEQEKKLLSLSSLLEGQETERIRIAKDLHDGLGGLLTNVKAHFSKIQAEIENLENLDIYSSASSMIDKAHDEVRRISHNLMPADLRAGGLPVAVRQLLHELKNVHEIHTNFELHGLDSLRLNEKLEISIYRIIQELINNMVKYAETEKAFIQISKFEKEIQLVVEDEGKGFDYETALQGRGLGLKSIKSRVEQLAGHMDVESAHGKGTSVTINIPFKEVVENHYRL